jgi:thioredoxin reductase
MIYAYDVVIVGGSIARLIATLTAAKNYKVKMPKED